MSEDQRDQSLEQKPPVPAAANASLWDDEVQSDVGEQPAATPQAELDADGLPTDNAARSSLGRKLTRYEQQMNEMRDSLNRMNDMMSRQMEERQYSPPSRSFPDGQTEDDLDDQVVTTYRDVKKLQNIEQQKAQQQQIRYQGAYSQYVNERPFRAKDTPADIHDEIKRELLETGSAQYRKHTSNPIQDAEINYGLAKAKVLERRYSEAIGRPNVRGATSRTPAAPVKSEKLDEVSEKFVRAMGANPEDEWVQNSIKRKDL
jgi:hypothetical protein